MGAREPQREGAARAPLLQIRARILLMSQAETARLAAELAPFAIRLVAESARDKHDLVFAWPPQAPSAAEIVKLYRAARGASLIVALPQMSEAAVQQAIVSGADDCIAADAPARAIADCLRRAQARARFRGKIAAELSLVQEVAEGLVVLDQDGAVRFANDAAESMLGAAPGSLLGRKFSYPLVENETTAIELPRGEGQAELRVVETEWGGVPARIASIADVSARKSLERARDRMLARGFSGEARTALTTIIGLAELMLAGKSGPSLHPRHAEYLNDIRESGEALLALLRSLGEKGEARKTAPSFG